VTLVVVKECYNCRVVEMPNDYVNGRPISVVNIAITTFKLHNHEYASS